MVTFLKNNSGVTLVEYGLIAALIAIAIVVGLQAVGTSLDSVFTAVSTAV